MKHRTNQYGVFCVLIDPMSANLPNTLGVKIQKIPLILNCWATPYTAGHGMYIQPTSDYVLAFIR